MEGSRRLITIASQRRDNTLPQFSSSVQVHPHKPVDEIVIRFEITPALADSLQSLGLPSIVKPKTAGIRRPVLYEWQSANADEGVTLVSLPKSIDRLSLSFMTLTLNGFKLDANDHHAAETVHVLYAGFGSRQLETRPRLSMEQIRCVFEKNYGFLACYKRSDSRTLFIRASRLVEGKSSKIFRVRINQEWQLYLDSNGEIQEPAIRIS
ncbi:MAG: hypothetical protein A2722_00400 [Candidatus Doudnabacteria bacterium RIFCSPHIGHO2_01_FULL_50_11]|uniref:Uncharacterized protein n=1 Tax=Candidatus Doudnabacteria bacterium RIFCSPHIGHO2_01_FULL_50_11 TaxID=1817828 RepID=A0A1F5PGZ2_9BACT|nr:MAG: hypothetical protein A2722_00400 [Candidatus Doudnabacteria bacterium RIFCSPHIGHO2_01_FULL_50_11]